jgi:NAD(P)-dependent dehydrogenase (short-subunit alcohol dehydrogenase family)
MYPNTKVTTYAASVTDFEHISAILREIGKIDILVPNVATSHPFVPSREVSTTDYKLTFDTNVVGTFHIIKEFLALPSTGPRVVINVSSASGQIVQPGNIGYGPSKAAGNQIIQHFAQEYANTDVTFQTFHPGVIRTEYAAKLSSEDAFDWEDGESFFLSSNVQAIFVLIVEQFACLVNLLFGLLVRKPASLLESLSGRNGMLMNF